MTTSKKPKDPTNTNDVTDEYIRSAYDIGKESRSVELSYSIGEVYAWGYADFISYDDYIAKLKAEIDERVNNFLGVRKARNLYVPETYNVKLNIVSNYFECDGEEKDLNVSIFFNVNETEQQTINRLKKNLKAKITAKNRKEKQEEKERKKDLEDFARLKEKYGDELLFLGEIGNDHAEGNRSKKTRSKRKS